MNEIVTIIVDRRNREEYLNRCINSIKRQDYSDIEYFVVDSIDKSYKGVFLPDEIKGDFVFFCSASDILSKDLISSLVDFIREKKECAIAQSFSIKSYRVVSDKTNGMTIFGKLFPTNVAGKLLDDYTQEKMFDFFVDNMHYFKKENI